MHDLIFTESIIKNVPNPKDVTSITLEVGELSGIEKDHLKEHLVERTGWIVDVIGIDSKVRCLCGYEGRAKIKERLHDLVIFSCPKCDLLPEVLSGSDIKIAKVRYK